MGHFGELDDNAFVAGVIAGAQHLIGKPDRGARRVGRLEATVAMALRPEADYGAWAPRACAELAQLSGNQRVDRVNLVSRRDGALRLCFHREDAGWQAQST
jgi:hypothetical protein